MKNIATLLTTVLTIAALFALTGWQVTGETAATRLLGRLGAAIIEIDRWLPAHQEDIKLVARDQEEGMVLIRDLPIEVNLPALLVIDADESTLRALITREMGRQLYEDGNSAFRDDEGGAASLGIDEPVRWAVFFLSPGMHGFWLAVLALTLLLALAAAAAAMTTGQTPVHAIAMGALIGALSSLAIWALTHLAGSAVTSAADREIVLILRDGAWIGVRNCGGVAFASGVLAFLVGMGRGNGAQSHYTPASTRTNSPF